MEDSSERSPLLFFLFLLPPLLFLLRFSRSNLRLFPISESSFLSSSFFFAPRLDGHRSRSIALSHSRISRIRLRRTLRLILYLLSLSFSSLLLLTLSLASRTLGPRRSCAHALLFSLARAACFPLSTDSCDRRSLQFGCFSLRRVVARVGRGSPSVSNCHIVPRRLSACFPRGENCDRENASRSVKPRSISW